MDTKAPNQVFISLDNHQACKPGSAIADMESEEHTSPLVPTTKENVSVFHVLPLPFQKLLDAAGSIFIY